MRYQGRAISITTACVLLLTLTGCNFFGKEGETEGTRLPGELSSGQSILGTWSFSYASPTATNNPSDAQSIMYSFEPNSVLRIEMRDPHFNGVSCTGYGQYRIAGKDVFAYIQASDSSACGFSSFTHLGAAEVQSQRILFKLPDGSTTHLFKVRPIPSVAPVGLWDFQGQGGFDWIYFDPHGYFLVQATFDDEMYLLIGYYKVAQNGLSLTFFDNLDPSTVSVEPIVFDQFVTDGFELRLVEQTDDGPVTYTGSRL